MDAKSFITGVVLMGIGGLFLADNFGLIYFHWSLLELYWPWILVAGGIGFWFGWLNNKEDSGLLLPGTILLVYGFLFGYCVKYGWWLMGEKNLWAFFIIGPGLGFLAIYFLSNREKGVLIPGIILSGLGGIFLFGSGLILSICLIALGVKLISSRPTRTK